MTTHSLAGIYVAAATPLKADYSPDYAAIPGLLDFLAKRGAHGALLLGTTGEGTSFSPPEREQIWQHALEVRQAHPDFKLLAGTGTPSLAESRDLTQTAFDLGFDGVMVLPPYYYRTASQDGLYRWFETLLSTAVPSDGALFGYHIPKVSGVSFSIELLQRLRAAFPDQFVGIKDSSGDIEHTRQVLEAMDTDFAVLVGSDRVLSQALSFGGSGCITAYANVASPQLRAIWDAHQDGKPTAEIQAQIDTAREIIDQFGLYPPSIKALLSEVYGFPRWPLRPPLDALTDEQTAELLTAIQPYLP
ncbi:MAG: dihydrodipicolinate synthase family protein [Anaerolineales bacterium]|nr:dihydrodipicolinate synthase family protein [Anaerolineales bacterium]